MPPQRDGNSPPESLLALQRQFAGHLRDPANVPENLRDDDDDDDGESRQAPWTRGGWANSEPL